MYCMFYNNIDISDMLWWVQSPLKVELFPTWAVAPVEVEEQPKALQTSWPIPGSQNFGLIL